MSIAKPRTGKQLFASGAIVGGCTLLSKATGLFRDMLMAKVFGASAFVDAFFVALRIPNFFRRTLGEGVFSNAFIPVYAKTIATDQQSSNLLVSEVSVVLSCTLLSICTLFIVFAPIVITIFAPGFSDNVEQAEAATIMLRCTMPYLFFISLSAMLVGILNTHNRFVYGAIAPTLFNICIIGAILIGQYMQLISLHILYLSSIAVSLSGLLQWVMLRIAISKHGHPWIPTLNKSLRHAKEVIRLMLPSMVASSAFQINALVDTIIASMLVVGSITWLYYGDRLMEVPLGIFAIAIGSVLLPALARSYAVQDTNEFHKTIAWGVRLVLFVSLPSLVGLTILATPIIQTFFQYGAFTSLDVKLTAYSLIGYVVGLPALMLIKVYSSAWFALQDSKKPMMAGLLSLGMHLALSIGVLLTWVLLSGENKPQWLHVLLALATSASALVNCFLLRQWLLDNFKEYYKTHSDGWDIVPKLTIACIAMATILLIAKEYIVIADGTFLFRLIQLTTMITIGTVVFFVTITLVGINVRLLITEKQ
ncbi:MAG: murein biosynthesis integral membrane protein MurJ [Methylacidiphilales bacterium]|nr:murein biosynthesis integral membrane protein MurJ [Candidatus Methylacidiphilales bacterium]